MNYDKLNELAATRVMGWHKENFSFYDADDEWVCPADHSPPSSAYSECEWRPATDAHDALELLERAAKGRGWAISYQGLRGSYWVDIPGCGEDCDTENVELPLAITLCALRAAGVSESEIESALSTSEGASR